MKRWETVSVTAITVQCSSLEPKALRSQHRAIVPRRTLQRQLPPVKVGSKKRPVLDDWRRLPCSNRRIPVISLQRGAEFSKSTETCDAVKFNKTVLFDKYMYVCMYVCMYVLLIEGVLYTPEVVFCN